MRTLARLTLLLAVGCAAAPPPDDYALHVLGAAQDGGRPHLGCDQGCCAGGSDVEATRVAALGLEAPGGRWWLIDATPDMESQVREMGGLPAGILLTHAHVGHYAGLMLLGREVAATDAMPVHCSAAMAAFLGSNQPWQQLVDLGQIELRPFEPGRPLRLDERLTIEPVRVPHRDELADTHGFFVRLAGGRAALYLPDIDAWEEWQAADVRELAGELDYLVCDGTFYSGAELPGRDMSEIPHPPIAHTMDLLEPALAASNCRVVFTHFNHTNPVWDANSSAARELRRRGFESAAQLRVLPLSPDP